MGMESNPYDPPRAPYDPYDRREEYQELEIAGKGRRFGTFIADYIISTICLVFLDIVLGVILGPEFVQESTGSMFFINVLGALGYYIFFEGVMARTPGKLIFGTKVVDENGGPASFGQILGRTVCRCIPFEPFSFFGERGWHDSIPKTSVVLAR